MITVKIHCDDCEQDIDVTCEGAYIVMRKPSDRSETGYRHVSHQMNSSELLPAIIRYLLPDIFNQAQDSIDDANLKEWLKRMGVDLE